MPRLYFYKLMADNGGAPCVQDGLLSLSICKPMIRSTAERGDLVFGFAANSLHRDNRLIYIAKITNKLVNGDYYDAPEYTHRPDRIYKHRGGRFHWRLGARHHGPKHLVHDLGEHPNYPRANVLLSTDFRYFGRNGTATYKSRFPHIKKAIERLERGHRVRHNKLLQGELLALKKKVWATTRKKVAGRPSGVPRRGVCHRARSCGIISVERGR